MASVCIGFSAQCWCPEAEFGGHSSAPPAANPLTLPTIGKPCMPDVASGWGWSLTQLGTWKAVFNEALFNPKMNGFQLEWLDIALVMELANPTHSSASGLALLERSIEHHLQLACKLSVKPFMHASALQKNTVFLCQKMSVGTGYLVYPLPVGVTSRPLV
eukprot:1145666-Pelagomonas_calceolata.AAC.4